MVAGLIIGRLTPWPVAFATEPPVKPIPHAEDKAFHCEKLKDAQFGVFYQRIVKSGVVQFDLLGACTASGSFLAMDPIELQKANLPFTTITRNAPTAADSSVILFEKGNTCSVIKYVNGYPTVVYYNC